MEKYFRVIVLFVLLSSSIFGQEQKNILIYCGITMVNPVKKMANILEKELDVKIVITQGGSADLYHALKKSQQGDIYIAGSLKYIKEHKQEGFFEEYMKLIGYNQAAIFVQKGNPHDIKNLEDLLRTDISSMLTDPKTGSIGKMTKTVLENFGGKNFYEDAYLNTIYVGTDSRNMNTAFVKNQIDIAINWRSTITFNANQEYIDIVDIDQKYAPKVPIPAVLLKSSQNKAITKKILDFMVSKRGKEIMKEYGFLK